MNESERESVVEDGGGEGLFGRRASGGRLEWEGRRESLP